MAATQAVMTNVLLFLGIALIWDVDIVMVNLFAFLRVLRMEFVNLLMPLLVEIRLVLVCRVISVMAITAQR